MIWRKRMRAGLVGMKDSEKYIEDEASSIFDWEHGVER